MSHTDHNWEKLSAPSITRRGSKPQLVGTVAGAGDADVDVCSERLERSDVVARCSWRVNLAHSVEVVAAANFPPGPH